MNLQLTLYYIGTVESAFIPEIEHCTAQIIIAPFALNLDQLGLFHRAGVDGLKSTISRYHGYIPRAHFYH